MALASGLEEKYRGTLRGQNPDGQKVTLIVTRQNSQIWLTLDGGWKSTLVMPQGASELISLLTKADDA